MQINLTKPISPAPQHHLGAGQTEYLPSKVEITDERPGDVLRFSKAAVANYHASLLRILWKASTIEEATEIAKEALEFGRLKQT